jgi:hypothetical protein
MAGDHGIDLTGTRILVTGGTSGLGLAMASALARAGATVVLTSRSADRAAAVAARLPNTTGIAAEVRDEASVSGAGPRSRSTSCCPVVPPTPACCHQWYRCSHGSGEPTGLTGKGTCAGPTTERRVRRFRGVALCSFVRAGCAGSGWFRVHLFGEGGQEPGLPFCLAGLDWRFAVVGEVEGGPLFHQPVEPVQAQRVLVPAGIGPLVLDQAPVPGEQGAGCHDPVQPQVPGSSFVKAVITARSAQSGFGRAT